MIIKLDICHTSPILSKLSQLSGTHLLASSPSTEGETVHSHWPLKSQHYSLQAVLAHEGNPLVVRAQSERVEFDD